MKTNPNSPFAALQQQMSSQIYSGQQSSKPGGWQCGSRISQSLALKIYQQNLHGGVAQHLQTHFPTVYAYVGTQAYQAMCAEYLKASPPDQPMFTLYAAHFPSFMLEHGEQNPQQPIWAVTAQLAQIDFFHHNAFCEGQQIEVEQHYYQLWMNTRSAMEHTEESISQGLYRQLDLHPEKYQQPSERITLVTFWARDELFFRVYQ